MVRALLRREPFAMQMVLHANQIAPMQSFEETVEALFESEVTNRGLRALYDSTEAVASSAEMRTYRALAERNETMRASAQHLVQTTPASLLMARARANVAPLSEHVRQQVVGHFIPEEGAVPRRVSPAPVARAVEDPVVVATPPGQFDLIGQERPRSVCQVVPLAALYSPLKKNAQ